MLDNRAIPLIEMHLDLKFPDLSKEYRELIIRYCRVLIFLEREKALVRLVESSETSEELLRDATRFMKLTLDEEMTFRIRGVKEKDNKSLEDHRFLFMIENIERFFKDNPDLL